VPRGRPARRVAAPRAASGASPPPPKSAVVSLRGLFDAWKVVTVVKPRTVAETDYAVKDLAGFLGHDDAAKIARGDLLRWRDAMKADGRNLTQPLEVTRPPSNAATTFLRSTGAKPNGGGFWGPKGTDIAKLAPIG